jgi:hypothetical protein
VENVSTASDSSESLLIESASCLRLVGFAAHLSHGSGKRTGRAPESSIVVA